MSVRPNPQLSYRNKLVAEVGFRGNASRVIFVVYVAQIGVV
jgi:hypothetical protein